MLNNEIIEYLKNIINDEIEILRELNENKDEIEFREKILEKLSEMKGVCKMEIEVSLKELGLICLGLEMVCDEEEELWEDREVCERLNERLVEILEREDN